uniref:phosphatidylserine decarboxylase proenzyme, mitochondrial-like n=1 Tax=Ciona intestinalis TaxID=7719 RepID=UPI000521C914|nr:phosphatidylserine decarboxylase proenzyme, mitochondrial-like [Ciona intestinalis]|eukprot:XP_002120113.3 phosphatidylserine decarboxylase proenzyme, mitochondrial-like [Ciona intestinalis]
MIVRIMNFIFSFLLCMHFIPGALKSFLGVKSKMPTSRKERARTDKCLSTLKRKHLRSSLRLWEVAPKNNIIRTSKSPSIIPAGCLVSGSCTCLVTIAAVSLTSCTFNALDSNSWYCLLLLASYSVWDKSDSIRSSVQTLLSTLQITTLQYVPFRYLSRLWGKLCCIHVPYTLRPYIYGMYITMFGVNLQEADPPNVHFYSTLGEFFRRKINLKLRPISNVQVVSPVDGTVLHNGNIANGLVEQLKGVSFSVQQFLGPLLNDDNNIPLVEYSKRLMMDPLKNKLYNCVIYLAPGDYHRFHSPVEWTVLRRRHFVGDLKSVNPRMVSWFPDLFVTNERVALCGKWKYGFFSMTAIGATNVGSIVVYHDKELVTNQPQAKPGSYFDHQYKDGLKFFKGDPLGEFKLGSTVVLLYEAPREENVFSLTNGKIKIGQQLSLSFSS